MCINIHQEVFFTQAVRKIKTHIFLKVVILILMIRVKTKSDNNYIYKKIYLYAQV